MLEHITVTGLGVTSLQAQGFHILQGTLSKISRNVTNIMTGDYIDRCLTWEGSHSDSELSLLYLTWLWLTACISLSNSQPE